MITTRARTSKLDGELRTHTRFPKGTILPLYNPAEAAFVYSVTEGYDHEGTSKPLAVHYAHAYEIEQADIHAAERPWLGAGTPLRAGGSGSLRHPLPPWSAAVELEVLKIVETDEMFDNKFAAFLPAIRGALSRVSLLGKPPIIIEKPQLPVGCSIVGEALQLVSEKDVPEDWRCPEGGGPLFAFMYRSKLRIRVSEVLRERVIALSRRDNGAYCATLQRHDFKNPRNSLSLPGQVLPDPRGTRDFAGRIVRMPYVMDHKDVWVNRAGLLITPAGKLSGLGVPDFLRLARFPNLLDGLSRPALCRLFENYLPLYLSFLERKPSSAQFHALLCDPTILYSVAQSMVYTLPLRSVVPGPIRTTDELMDAIRKAWHNVNTFHEANYTPMRTVDSPTYDAFRTYARSVVTATRRNTTSLDYAANVKALTDNLATAWRCSGMDGTPTCEYFYELSLRALNQKPGETAGRTQWVRDASFDDDDLVERYPIPVIKERMRARPAEPVRIAADISSSRVKHDDLSSVEFWTIYRIALQLEGLVGPSPWTRPVQGVSFEPHSGFKLPPAQDVIDVVARAAATLFGSARPAAAAVYESLAELLSKASGAILAFVERVQPVLAGLFRAFLEGAGSCVAMLKLVHAAIATKAVECADGLLFICDGRPVLASAENAAGVLLSAFYGPQPVPHGGSWQLRDVAIVVSLARTLVELYRWILDAAAHAFGGTGRSLMSAAAWLSATADYIAAPNGSSERLTEMAAHAVRGIEIITSKRDPPPLCATMATSVAKLLAEVARRKARLPVPDKVEPIAVFISGQPGCGKDIAAIALTKIVALSLGTTVWTKPPVTDYASAFCGQRVALIPDFLQDSRLAENTEALIDFIHTISAEPTTAETPDVESKGLPLNLAVCVYTTNLPVVAGRIELNGAYLVNIDAVHRRVGMTLTIERQSAQLWLKVASHRLPVQPARHTIDTRYTVAQIAQWLHQAHTLRTEFAASMASVVPVTEPMEFASVGSFQPITMNEPHSYQVAIAAALGLATGAAAVYAAALACAPRIAHQIVVRYRDYLASCVRARATALVTACASFVVDGLGPVWAAAHSLWELVSTTVLDFARRHPTISMAGAFVAPLTLAWFAFSRVVSSHSSAAVPSSSDGTRARLAISRRPVAFHVGRNIVAAPHSRSSSMRAAVDAASVVVIAKGPLGSVTGSGVGTCLGGYTYLVPTHVLEGGVVFEMQSRHERQPSVYSASDCTIVTSTGSTGDITVFTVPPAGRSPGQQLNRFFLANVDDGGVLPTCTVVTPRGDVDVVDVTVSGAASWGSYSSDVTLRYNYALGALAPGSSGALVLSESGIIGMHVAGSAGAGFGLAVPLTGPVLATLCDQPYVLHSSVPAHPQGLCIQAANFRASSALVRSSLEPVPELYREAFQRLSPNKTLKVPVTCPLGQFDGPSIMRQGPKPTVSYDAVLMRRVIEYVYAVTLPPDESGHRAPLAVLSHDEGFRTCDPASSCGLPWTTLRVRLKGDMGESGVLKSEFVSHVDFLFDMARSGATSDAAGLMSNLKVKDEALQPGKVPRVIHVVPGTLTVGTAMHFTSVAREFMFQRRERASRTFVFEGITYDMPARSPLAGGTNPHCIEWAEIHQFLHANPMLDIDAVGCDDSLQTFWFEYLADICNARLAGNSSVYTPDGVPTADSEDDRMRKQMLMWMPQMTVHIHGWLLQRVYGNNSGQRLTTEVNGLAVLASWLYGVCRVKPELSPPQAFQYAPIIDSGDDCVVAHPPTLSFSAVSTVVFADLGIDFGPGDKSQRGDRSKYDSYKVAQGEAAFLKRTFVHVPDVDLVIAPLCAYTILSTSALRKINDPGRCFQAARLEAMLSEAGKHSEEFYTSFSALVATMARETGVPLRSGLPLSYAELRRIIYAAAASPPGYYVADFLDHRPDLEDQDYSSIPGYGPHSLRPGHVVGGAIGAVIGIWIRYPFYSFTGFLDGLRAYVYSSLVSFFYGLYYGIYYVALPILIGAAGVMFGYGFGYARGLLDPAGGPRRPRDPVPELVDDPAAPAA